MNENGKRVIFAEDHNIVAGGMLRLFEREFQDYLLDHVTSGRGLFNALKANQYDYAIIDLTLEDGDTFHLIENILAIYPDLRIMIFTGNPEKIYASRLYSVGIRGFLNKLATDAEISNALHLFLQGKDYLSDEFKTYLLSKLNPGTDIQLNPFELLTSRELDVVNQLLTGKKIGEVASELNLHSNTISTYKNRVFDKLGITNSLQLTELARNFGMI